MNGLPYYKSYPRDFIEGTIGMAFELKAAYRVVLDLVYMQGGNLPDDPRYISGLLGCTIKKWNALRDALISAGKLYVSGAFLRNHRADKELETLAKFQEKQRENRSRPNKNKEIESPRSDHTEPDTNKTKEISLTGASPSLSVEAELYRVGKAVLGSGGLVTKVLAHCKQDHRRALDIVRKAAEKGDPQAWIGGVLRQPEDDPWRGVDCSPLTATEIERYRAMGLS